MGTHNFARTEVPAISTGCGWIFARQTETLPHELTPKEWFAIVAIVRDLELQGRDCRETLLL